MRMGPLWRAVRLAGAVALLAGSFVLITAPASRAADDPYPANLAVEGDSWPQFTMQQQENDAFNANALGTLAPKFIAPTPAEAAVRTDLASSATDLAAVSESLTPSDLATAQQNGITPGYVPYGLSGVSIIVGISVAAGYPAITSLNLTVSTLAKIMTHKIQSWSDPEILAENPDEETSLLHPKTTLPIQVVERRTSSPTTAALISAFLADPTARPIWDTYAPLWGSPPDTVLDIWPSDTLITTSGTSAGEEGVVSAVLDLQASGPPGPQNAIGYVTPQWAHANNAIQVALAPSGSSNFVPPDTAGVQAAFSSPGVTFDSSTDLYTIDYSKLTKPGAYPIPLPAYLAFPLKGGRAAKAAATLGLLNFVLSSAGQADDTATQMVPLPAAAMTAAQAVVAQFKSSLTPATTTTTARSSTTPIIQTGSGSSGAGSGSQLSGSGSQSGGSSGLPNTGARLPMGVVALGLSLLLAGELSRRTVFRRASRRARR